MKYFYIILITILACLAWSSSLAQQSDYKPFMNVKAAEHIGKFTKKRYTIHGDWSVSQDNGQTSITFGESFKTKGGPDLKVFLSPRSLGDLTDKTALENAKYISVLKSNSGEQTYILPTDINLAAYESVIIQCEAFSVLWGGFDIPEGTP